MRSKITRWGRGLGLRIPKAIAEALGVSDGTPVDLVIAGGQLVVRAVPAQAWSLDALLAGVTPANTHGERAASGPVGRETW